MERVSKYGIGCGSALVLAGVIELIGLVLGWNEDSNLVIFRILQIVGNAVGSPYLGAGIYIVLGICLVLLGLGLTETLRAKQPVGNGTAGIPTPRGMPASQQFYVGEHSKAEHYLNFVESNLLRSGFEPIPFSQAAKVFHKKDARRSNEFYFIFGCMTGPLTPEKVEKISQQTFGYASRRKRANTMFCYPVIVSENVQTNVQKFIRSYSRKHMAQFEFPVIVDLTSRNSYYYTGTPLWGAFMYRAIRDNVDTLLRFPKA